MARASRNLGLASLAFALLPHHGPQYNNQVSMQPVDDKSLLHRVDREYPEPLSNVKYASRKNYAVIVVDSQPSFIEEMLISEQDKEIQNHRQILDYCSTHDIPVVVLELDGSGETEKIIRDRVANVPRHIYLKKNENDGFTNPRLPEQLRKWNIEAVLLMGLNASFCVKATAKGALAHNLSFATAMDITSDAFWFHAYPPKETPIRENQLWFYEHGVFALTYRELIPLLGKD
ncbi:MAG TPA: isochorismatase family protein [Candidatus Nanoarchaeia archaeon]|nr:isochorismatase family protein [Candidatus Nanoarchaeia archaeon]